MKEPNRKVWLKEPNKKKVWLKEPTREKEGVVEGTNKGKRRCG